MDERTTIANLERRLAESETRHRQLIDNWAQAVWETDAHGVVVADSPSWRAYTGQTLEQWFGYGWLDAIHPDDRAYAERQWRAAMADQGLVDAEFRLRAPDGGWRWTNVRAAPVLDSGGHIEKWAGMNIDIHARKQAEAALRESEARYRTLFESMDEGYLLSEVIFGEHNTAIDIHFLEANPAALRMAGRDFTGQRMREIDPRYEQYWYDAYGRVALTGISIHTEHYAEPHNRWFDFQLSRVGSPQSRRVASVFQDITERKLAEQALRQNQERQAFLLALSDALRPLDDPLAVQNTAMKLLAERLNVMRATFFEIEHDQDTFRLTARFERDAVPIPEQMRLSDFSPALLHAYTAGRTLSVSDTAIAGEFVLNPDAYVRLGIGAWAAVPLVRNGQLFAWLGVHSATSRDWSPADLRALEDVAERTWGAVERARAEQALVKSETKYRILFDSIDEGFCIIQILFDEHGKAVDFAFLESNPVFEKQAGFKIARGMRMREIAPHHEQYWFDIYGRIARTGEPARFEHEAAAFGIVYDVYAFRVDEPALGRVAVVFRNVTESKRAEQALRESEERFAQFAASSSDALWIRDAATLSMEYTSPAIQTVYGIAPDGILGDMRRWIDVIVPEDRDTAITHIKEAQAGGSVTHEFRVRRPADGEVRWIRNTDFPLRDADGRVQRVGGIAQDITEAKRSSARLEVLVNELQHRARNLLGVVTAIADRTVKQGGSVAAFEERLQALSRAQALLSQGGSDTVEVGDLVRAELAAHAPDASERVSATGPAVYLTARQVQNFALAVHELTTNAVKYGALKQSTGHLAIAWEIVRDRRERRNLVLNWVESGVAIEPDKVMRRGYGTELIEQALTYALQATVAYAFGPDGVRCRIEMPV